MTVKPKHQEGSALVYILIAIALLGALTATFMDSSSQQTTSQNTFNTVSDVDSQVNFIRSAIQECVLTYPGGDTSNPSQINAPYPLNPTNAYLSATTPVTTTDKISGLRCPGNPGTSNVHAAIFGGSSGKFLPPAPKLFNDWLYYSGEDGVFFWTSTNNTDAFLATALTRLDEKYSECETDVIDNSAGGSALNILSAGSTGTATCAANSLCFRVWVIAQTRNIYPGDTDTDESGCP